MSNNNGAGKGDKRRPGDEKAYRYNYELIFGFWGTCECCQFHRKLKTVRTTINALVNLCESCRKEPYGEN